MKNVNLKYVEERKGGTGSKGRVVLLKSAWIETVFAGSGRVKTWWQVSDGQVSVMCEVKCISCAQ